MATTTTRWIYICGIGVVDDVKLGGMDWVGWDGGCPSRMMDWIGRMMGII